MKKVLFILALLFAVNVASFAQENSDTTVAPNESIAQNNTPTAEQRIENIDKTLQELVAGMENNADHQSFYIEELADGITAILAITLTLLFPVAIVFIVFHYRHKKKKAEYAIIQKAVESGQPIPSGLFTIKREQENQLVKGIKNLFLGIGLSCFLWFLTKEIALVGIGIMVSCIGLGEIAIHLFVERKEQKAKKTCEEGVEIIEMEEANKAN